MRRHFQSIGDVSNLDSGRYDDQRAKHVRLARLESLVGRVKTSMKIMTVKLSFT